MVFEANSPNKDKKTWFGYMKNDGFVKRKNKGRIDHYSQWKDIKAKLISAYHNNDEVVGLSVKKAVSYKDEWCAKAYMETDYSLITQSDFELVMKNYAIFKHIGIGRQVGDDEQEDDEN